jgi:hypothetical protein
MSYLSRYPSFVMVELGEMVSHQSGWYLWGAKCLILWNQEEQCSVENQVAIFWKRKPLKALGLYALWWLLHARPCRNIISDQAIPKYRAIYCKAFNIKCRFCIAHHSWPSGWPSLICFCMLSYFYQVQQNRHPVCQGCHFDGFRHLEI